MNLISAKSLDACYLSTISLFFSILVMILFNDDHRKLKKRYVFLAERDDAMYLHVHLNRSVDFGFELCFQIKR